MKDYLVLRNKLTNETYLINDLKKELGLLQTDKWSLQFYSKEEFIFFITNYLTCYNHVYFLNKQSLDQYISDKYYLLQVKKKSLLQYMEDFKKALDIQTWDLYLINVDLFQNQYEIHISDILVSKLQYNSREEKTILSKFKVLNKKQEIKINTELLEYQKIILSLLDIIKNNNQIKSILLNSNDVFDSFKYALIDYLKDDTDEENYSHIINILANYRILRKVIEIIFTEDFKNNNEDRLRAKYSGKIFNLNGYNLSLKEANEILERKDEYNYLIRKKNNY